MHTWQLQEAKAKLTQFVNDAKHSPQVISRHGVPEIVAISIEKYHALTRSDNDLVSFLKNSPLYNIDLDIKRDKTPMRDIEDL